MKHITSRDNPIYRGLLQLAGSPRDRRESGRMLLDGLHLLQAYRDAYGMEQVQVIARSTVAERPEIARWLHTGHQPIVLADGLFDALAAVETPSGILAAVPIPKGPAGKPPAEGFGVLLDGVQDPGNVGSILRSAAAAGAAQAYLSSQCADPWSPKCLRGGMGAQFALRIEDRADLPATAVAFDGKLIALDAAASASLFELDLSVGKVAFILGSEGGGIDPRLSALAQLSVGIPMRPGVDSLNVGAAAAVCFFEWARQRRL
jgi:TrmH family RNA methyltransferase